MSLNFTQCDFSHSHLHFKIHLHIVASQYKLKVCANIKLNTLSLICNPVVQNLFNKNPQCTNKDCVVSYKNQPKIEGRQTHQFASILTEHAL